jgi:hypothetical protein
VQFLFTDLRTASEAHQHAGNDRAGVVCALKAISAFLMLFRTVERESLHLPLIALYDALIALYSNKVLPLLAPAARPAIPPATEARQVTIGAAAYVVASLQRKGLRRPAACAAVAKRLGALGLRPERGPGALTGRTGREWCDRVSMDYARHGIAAKTFDGLCIEFDRTLSRMQAKQAETFLLNQLTDVIRSWLQVDASSRYASKKDS